MVYKDEVFLSYDIFTPNFRALYLKIQIHFAALDDKPYSIIIYFLFKRPFTTGFTLDMK